MIFLIFDILVMCTASCATFVSLDVNNSSVTICKVLLRFLFASIGEPNVPGLAAGVGVWEYQYIVELKPIRHVSTITPSGLFVCATCDYRRALRARPGRPGSSWAVQHTHELYIEHFEQLPPYFTASLRGGGRILRLYWSRLGRGARGARRPGKRTVAWWEMRGSNWQFRVQHGTCNTITPWELFIKVFKVACVCLYTCRGYWTHFPLYSNTIAWHSRDLPQPATTNIQANSHHLASKHLRWVCILNGPLCLKR